MQEFLSVQEVNEVAVDISASGA